MNISGFFKIWLKVLMVAVLVLGACQQPSNAMGDADKELLNRAKLALFDRKWDRALEELDRLMKEYPNTPYFTQVLFYTGKCWENKKDEIKALQYYNRFIDSTRNESLKEEALAATINLNFTLYTRGKKGYIEKIVQLLDSGLWVVRNYAAIKLSYVRDKKIAAEAVPVLKRIIRNEDDPELVDRAKIALMRINPKYLRQVSPAKTKKFSTLFIRVFSIEDDKEVFSFSFPFALAKLALEALPDEQKDMLKEKGHDLEGIINTVIRDMEPIRIKTEDIILEIGLK
jgi:tetratricopeptide (TPR) repeat protein